jgi:hypothetical protein
MGREQMDGWNRLLTCLLGFIIKAQLNVNWT